MSRYVLLGLALLAIPAIGLADQPSSATDASSARSGLLALAAEEQDDARAMEQAAAADEPVTDEGSAAGDVATGDAVTGDAVTRDEPAEDEAVEDEPAVTGASEEHRPERVADAAADEQAEAQAAARDDGDLVDAADEALFPTSPVIERQKAFWVRIFTEVHSDQGLIHDGALTAPVYELLDLSGMSRRAQLHAVRTRKRAIATNLRGLADDLAHGRTPDAEGRALLARMPAGVTPDDLRDSAREVRFQRGLADRFRKGLIESGSYLRDIRRILRAHGVPQDLSYLPHVESSFNYRAYSKFGAAGIWQFTRSTGKAYMRVEYEVDERLDPLIATRAAAKFLRQNHKRLGSWPLAITAYNHGPNSLDSIVRRTGSNDLGVLIETYHGRLFKFASKNFYAEFLAAREVARAPERYFGTIAFKPPLNYQRVKLPYYLPFDSAVAALEVEADLLQQLNPGLRRPVLLGDKYIPRGYELRIPGAMDPQAFLSAVPEDSRNENQKRTWQVVVRRGDTLYDIGRRHGVPWPRIAAANNISRYHRIRPGQRLVLPGLNGPPLPVAAAEKEEDQQPVVTPASAVVSDDTGTAQRTPYTPPSRQGPAATIDAFAYQPAEGPAIFPDLAFQTLYPARQMGMLLAAFGETVGHYADWAQVPTNEIRGLNEMSFHTVLQPGREIYIPLERVSHEEFFQRRNEYHQQREEDFYSAYGVAELEQERVRRGDTLWSIAQNANMPMWLLYRENPKLINKGLRIGMTVNVPVIEELQLLQAQQAQSE